MGVTIKLPEKAGSLDEIFSLPNGRADELHDKMAELIDDAFNKRIINDTTDMLRIATSLAENDNEFAFLCFAAGASDSTIREAVMRQAAEDMFGDITKPND